MMISVVVPVYKAEEFIHQAVESVLRQPETGEVLLVEDDSPDNCLAICRELEKCNERVKLLRHPGGGNRGAGASRNLGIRNAAHDYVAFLDADDYYLDGRFSEATRIFRSHKDIDGVYEAVGTYFQDAQSKRNWLSWGHSELQVVNGWIHPEQLFTALLTPGTGWLHLNGLVVKREVFERCGYFFEHLRLHQDTALVLQLAASSRLYPGRLNEAVAMRRVYGHNRMPGANPISRALFCRTLFHWALERQIERTKILVLFQKYLYFSIAAIRCGGEPGVIFGGVKDLLAESLSHPSLFIAAMGMHIRNSRRQQ